ncbi:FTR1 family protein [Bacillus tianshenii]|nr:FTR1 family protein [Bacillus tianshenii]
MDFQAFLITLREALEAILIVGLILSYLTRLNAEKYHKWVYAGVGLALVTSFLVALVFQVVFTGFASFGSEVYMKVTIMFASVLLLTHMVVWMSKESANINGELQKKLNAAITAGSVSALIIHTYLVVVREGVETVFFFAAIGGGDIEKAVTNYGALSGLMLALILGYLFFTGTMKISLKAFFQITSIMIMFIAAGLLVQGVGTLQDLGKMGSVFEQADGTPTEMYNIVHVMPEHYQDEAHYERDTGNEVMVSGQIGLFMAAMFGYSHNPSFEQIAIYWLYFAFVFAWMKLIHSGRVPFRLRKKEKSSVKTNTSNVSNL